MADEIRRVAAKGCHAVTFSENPSKLGLPSYHTDSWDPFFAACVDTEVTVCLHIGSSSSMTVDVAGRAAEVMIALTPVNSLQAVTDILFSGVFSRFPGLQIAMSEGGIGWIPYALERADYVYRHHHAWTHTDLGGKLPSELFHEHFWTCFIDDRAGSNARSCRRRPDHVGDGLPALRLDVARRARAAVGEHRWPERRRDRQHQHRNAMRAFAFDPFRTGRRSSATVRPCAPRPPTST